MSTHTYPAFAPQGVTTVHLSACPQEADGAPDKLIRVFAFERRSIKVPDVVLGLFGVDGTYKVLGKQLWAKADPETGRLWARLDHFIGTADMSSVWVEQRWAPFADLKERFPRFLQPFVPGQSSAELRNRKCHHPRRSSEPDLDDYEPSLEWQSGEEDQTLPDGMLSTERYRKVIDEVMTQAC